jgi:twitching motility protein PilT
MPEAFAAADLLRLVGAPTSPPPTGAPGPANGHAEMREVPDNTDLDVKAVQMLGEGVQGVCPVRLINGKLLVAWATPPTPAQIQQIQNLVGGGIDIIVGLCSSEQALQALRQRAQRLRQQSSPLTERLLDQAIALQASDIHLSVGDLPKVRVGGKLRAMGGQAPVSRADIDEVVRFLIPPERLEHFEHNRDLDCAATYGGWRLRISLYFEMQSRALAIRIIPRDILSVQELGLPTSILSLTEHSHGLVLVCGATGSGKTTTLAAMIEHINANRNLHILTIEDPVEYIHTDRKSTIHQREVGLDTNSFPLALRHALRQDPDVILVGEMRDLETVRTALEAAETGHLVLATLHVRDAASAPTRIIGIFPEQEQEQIRQQLAEALRGVVVQRLLPAANNPVARVVVCEIMFANEAIRNLIRKNELQQIKNAISTGRREGMQLFDLDLARAVREHKISREVALAACTSPQEFEAALAAAAPVPAAAVGVTLR